MTTTQPLVTKNQTESEIYNKAYLKAIDAGKAEDFAHFFAKQALSKHTIDHAWALAILREYLLKLSKNKSYIHDTISWIESHVDNISIEDLSQEGKHYNVVYEALLNADQLEYA
ncbi:MAG: hypothetical protein ACRC6R_07625 [Bacteroidales bacterium]